MFRKQIETFRKNRDILPSPSIDRYWHSGVIFGIKHIANLLKDNPLKVVIVFKAGVAYVNKCPRGVTVKIVDLD